MTSTQTDPTSQPQRRMRSDARDNRERILKAAKAVFAERGTASSLNEIARRANVGPGTLYRHFPTLQDLLVAIIGDDVDVLCATGRDLLTHRSPDEALRIWLRAVALHATAMNGLVATQMAADLGTGHGTALAGCHDAITAVGSELLTRAKEHGGIAEQTDVVDLLKLATAIAWASEQAPEDVGLLDRLLALAITRS
ncbi:bacterial regulatory, tetR family protein [Rhodococcus sp. MTM3W5.2]|uniref:TetR/AcrR family transcriptional regulator n=1 Tax=Rhodococcus sp. MTM3W5.2 TaxID=1805827 RepID=UPI0009791FB6|nr:TetR/AcrR family transcriptional regulator [Rhodococcus sp. MTM3W5.2]AQA26081.1 bacterial regulatory, tetR family protein [Rhodococcus sp. MTM3W5.2]